MCIDHEQTSNATLQCVLYLSACVKHTSIQCTPLPELDPGCSVHLGAPESLTGSEGGMKERRVFRKEKTKHWNTVDQTGLQFQVTCLMVMAGLQSLSSSRMERHTVPDGYTFGWKSGGSNLPTKEKKVFVRCGSGNKD